MRKDRVAECAEQPRGRDRPANPCLQVRRPRRHRQAGAGISADGQVTRTATRRSAAARASRPGTGYRPARRSATAVAAPRTRSAHQTALAVIRATPEELAAHQSLLERIDKASGGTCLFRTL